MTGATGGDRPLRVVAFGGGHGLGASLRALRRLRTDLSLDITAVVTVADDGGSSGRLRAERDALPPGDLRQALAALADGDHSLTADLLQYRFGGDDPLAGHAVGNVLLVGLMELLGDPVAALDHAARLVGAHGRVLPMSPVPVDIVGEVADLDDRDPDGLVTVRGQHALAVTRGRVVLVRLRPAAPPACAEAVAAVRAADWLIFGPGSWYTSVIPHLLVPDLRAAIAGSPGRRMVALNLAAEKETAGLSHSDHVAVLRAYMPELTVDVVLADGTAVGDPDPVRRAAESLGARLVLAPLAVADGDPRHDPAAFAAALHPILAPDADRPYAGSAAGPRGWRDTYARWATRWR